MGILEDAAEVLLFLANFERTPGDSKKGRYSFDGPELSKKAGLDPDRLNDAVNVLDDNGYVDVMKFLGTAPFDFGHIELTSRGRAEAQRLMAAPAEEVTPAPEAGHVHAAVATTPSPVGSPFGFREEDWETVMLARRDKTRLVVVFGHQWKSPHFSTDDLRKNVGDMFADALSELQRAHPALNATLDYRPLQGGYGGHLFNEIACSIIAADVAVFDTSDLNPNVMIEMGVALTWGIRVLPVRETSAPKPPSDVSGQTWAEYENSGAKWCDPDHDAKLGVMVERAFRKKGTAF